MNKELNGINKFIEGKTFVYDHRVSFSEKPMKAYYQFHIDKVAQLRSIGEMKDHLFVSVKLVNGEGMVNYYLCAFGNKQKMTGRDHVNKQWYEFFWKMMCAVIITATSNHHIHSVGFVISAG